MYLAVVTAVAVNMAPLLLNSNRQFTSVIKLRDRRTARHGAAALWEKGRDSVGIGEDTRDVIKLDHVVSSNSTNCCKLVYVFSSPFSVAA